MAALLVEPREAKRVRATAEQLGVFDPSRKIGPYAGSEYNNTEAKKLLALPVILPPSSEHGQQQQTEDLLKAYPLVQDATLLPSASALSKERSPRQTIVAALQQLLSSQAAPAISKARREQLLQSVPSRWEEHGDLLLLPCNSFSEPEWRHFGRQLWETITRAVPRFQRIAIQHAVDPNPMRTSRAQLVLGESPLVTHNDNGIKYTYDITRLMFSRGNISEKLRVASFPCTSEVVVDLYAGIGYFTLPYLVHAQASKVIACEWNPEAVEMLKRNLKDNKVDARCEVLAGDNRTFPYLGIADRVNLGLIPTSQASWHVATRALRQDRGGWLHIHENVTIESTAARGENHRAFASFVEGRIRGLLEGTGVAGDKEASCAAPLKGTDGAAQGTTESADGGRGCQQRWSVCVRHIEFVKSYAPRIDHVVFDVECRPAT